MQLSDKKQLTTINLINIHHFVDYERTHAQTD